MKAEDFKKRLKRHLRDWPCGFITYGCADTFGQGGELVDYEELDKAIDAFCAEFSQQSLRPDGTRRNGK